MKDESTMMRESVWVDDRNITECQQCKKPFSMARRKVVCTRSGCVGVWSVMEGGAHEKVALCGKTHSTPREGVWNMAVGQFLLPAPWSAYQSQCSVQ